MQKLALQNVMFRTFGFKASELGVQWIDADSELTRSGMTLKHQVQGFCDVIDGTQDSGMCCFRCCVWGLFVRD